MALVKGPAGGIAASGTIGGTVYARNRAGQYARAWAKPVNPGTVRQAFVRSQFGHSSSTWGALSTGQVASWDAYGAMLTRLNRLGEPYTPKGRQIYMEVNNNLQQAQAAMLDSPSAFTDNPAMTLLGATTATVTAGVLTAMTLASAGVSIPSGTPGVILIEATPPHDAKLTNVNNLFRQIAVEDPTGGPFNVLARYIAVFGSAATVGQIISFRVRCIDDVSGLGSSYLYQDEAVA